MAKEKKDTKTKTGKHPGGRPPKANKKEIQDAVCHLISTTSLSIRKILAELTKNGVDDVPSLSTVLDWLYYDKEFSEQYARAKEKQCEVMAEEIIEISDNDSLDAGFTEDGKQFVNHENINRSRLRVDSRKWVLSKLKPKKYGDKLAVDTPTELQITVVYEDKLV